MILKSGDRIGPYEIVSPLGAGGMGEVYKARDTRLERFVAIKILPANLGVDATHRERFRREARAISSLTHPHICTLHDVGDQDGLDYLVMEYLPGETLAHRLLRGPLPLGDVLQISVQLADALDVAHRAGLIHRDLKPANVMLTASGAKVLDFGLAKWHGDDSRISASVIHPPTLTTLTQAGTVIGTVQYMAPEQVEGKPADGRSDLFALGAIIYEMITGKKAFEGTSVTGVMAAILTSEPPRMGTLQPVTPRELERVVKKCLAKEPLRRWQSAADLRDELKWIEDDLRTNEGVASSNRSPAKNGVPNLRQWRTMGLAAVGGAATLAILLMVLSPFAPFGGVRGSTAPHPSFRQLTFRRGVVHAARFAPDGRTVVYSAAWDGKPFELYTTRIEAPESQRLDLPPAGLFALSSSGEVALSNQCHWVNGTSACRGTLARVPLTGGLPHEELENVWSADWLPDGTLAAIRRTPRGFQLEYPLGTVIHETVSGQMAHLRVSPTENAVAFAELTAGPEPGAAIRVTDRKGQIRTLVTGLSYVNGLAWSPDGREIWFTASSGRLTMYLLEAVTLDGHRRMLDGSANNQLLDVARDGRILLARRTVRAESIVQDPSSERNLSWFDFTIADALSRDGQRLLFSERGAAAEGVFKLYVRGTEGSPPIKLGDGLGLAFSPDGKFAVARSATSPGQTQLTVYPFGVGRTQSLDRANLNQHDVASFLPDGKSVVFAADDGSGARRTYVQALDGLPQLVAHEPGAIGSPLSSDGVDVSRVLWKKQNGVTSC
jgi:serine/threonine protein kinase